MSEEEEEEERLEKEEEVRRRGAIILDKEEFYRDAVWVSEQKMCVKKWLMDETEHKERVIY